MPKISVFGGGAWGKALHLAFSKTNHCSIVSRKNLGIESQISSQVAQESEFLLLRLRVPLYILGLQPHLYQQILKF